MINLTINGKRIATEEGKTILEAALDNGIYIPHLCYHPDLEPVGVCRLCMVDIGKGALAISCKTPVEDGLDVRTETPEIKKARRIIIELFAANTDVDYSPSEKNEFQQLIDYIGVKAKDLRRLKRYNRKLPQDTSNPFFDRDPNKCILCGICIRTCSELQRVRGIDFASRGYNAKVGTFGDRPLSESTCESCGECLVRCPTGTLRPKSYIKPESEVKTTCPYCGVGCGFYLGIRDG